MELPRVGLRTIKTAIAVMITAGIMHYVFNETPFFACVGATVSVGKTRKSSFEAAIVRNIGTAVGGFIGMFVASITENVFLKGLGVIPVIYFIRLIGKKESTIPGCIVYYAVIYLNTVDTAGLYAIRRISETLFGSLIGILVNFGIRGPVEEEDYDDN